MTAELKVWFLRDVLDSLERERGEGILVRLVERVPERLRAMLNLPMLRTKSPLDAIPLDEGEELLLGVDAALGDGGGRILEGVGLDLAGRMFFQEGSSVIVGDLFATAARLRVTLQRPFVGSDIVFELVKNELGFSLSVGVPGRPRSTKILRSLAAGALRAAQRYAHEPGTSDLRIASELFGDRALLAITYRSASQPPSFDESEPEPRRRSPISFKPPRVPSLVAEVERILGGRASEPAPPSMRGNGEAPSQRPSAAPPRRTSAPPPKPDAGPDEDPSRR